MNDRFLRACRRQEVDRTPIWLMRQAGRYMPEFRALRAEHDFLTRVKTPELATAITLQPIKAFPLDAAIIFADIIPPLEGMGLVIEFNPAPVIHNPLRTPADIAALRQPDPRESVAFTLEAIRLVKRELAGKLPLIGFSGAPFTLASYAIEGGGSRDFKRTKLLMYQQPEAWHALMTRLATLVGDYLLAQAEAGADALQIFDSWAGALAPGDYVEHVLPYVQQVIARVQGAQAGAQGAPESTRPPVIYFGTDMSGMLPLLRHTGADVLGVDWRVYLDDAWAQIGPGFAIQGNLDPLTLYAPWPEIERRAADILKRAAGRPGHIFNLGHGIRPEPPVEHVARLVEFVHAYPE
jgi:uroporphyrinogen decarboxylase